MQGNIEEEEKCSEKLNEMQKYLPFLDFMIDKIQKKNSEISLDCQLSKFQLLRSMISEKNGKHSWDVIVKAEGVIEKLISKLDYKEQYEKFKQHSPKASSLDYEGRMSTPVSIVFSSTPNVTVPTTSTTQAALTDLNNPELSTRAVDLIMKTLKISIENNVEKCAEIGNELSCTSEADPPLDISCNPMETDLDKDLDGFDLVDCSTLSETETSNISEEPAEGAIVKPASGDDLLSSSREKLLKSLQSRLFPSKTQADFSGGSKNEKPSETHYSSAFSRSQINIGERKTKSDVTDSSEHKAVDRNKKDSPVKSYDKKMSATPYPLKFVSSVEKTRVDPGNVSGDNLKQRLKEKLSSVIGEVYRVPGKSVGGSLRSLKESKDQRRSSVLEENELHKPDKHTEMRADRFSYMSQSRSSTETKNHSNKSHRESSSSQRKREKSSERTSHKSRSSSSGKHDKKHASKNSKDSDNYSRKNESSRNSKCQEKKPDGKKSSNVKGEKNFDLEKLNDDELLKFVKENMQSLPHLSKLKLDELRKTVRASLCSNFSAIDADAISEISDDSLQDIDDVCVGNRRESKRKSNSDEKNKSEEPHFLASVKIAQVGSDGVAKNVKPIVEPSKDTKVLEEVGDKTHDMDDDLDGIQDEEDYALKLIEETTPKSFFPKGKKGSLELPIPITDDLFEDISSIESFETSTSPTDKRASESLKVSSEGNDKPNEAESQACAQVNPESNKSSKEVRPSSNNHPSSQPFKDPNSKPHITSAFSNVPTDNPKTHPSNQDRSDSRLAKSVSSHCSQDNYHFVNKYPVEADGACRNTKAFPNPCHVNDPRRQSYSFSEPKSYAEYKRRKLKEQRRISYQVQKVKEDQKSILFESLNKAPAPVEKEDASKKTQDSWHSEYKDWKQNNSKTQNVSRSSNARQRRYSDHSKKSQYEEARKEEDKTRHSLDSEDLVSPLEELYSSEKKPKTGRGYGIQHFKIPKKVQGPVPQKCSKPNPSTLSNSYKTDEKTPTLHAPSSVSFSKGTKEPRIIEVTLDGEDEEKSTKESEEIKNNQVKKPDNTTELEKEKNSSATTNTVEPETKVDECGKNSEQTNVPLISFTISKDVTSISEKNESRVECAETDVDVIPIDFTANEVIDSSKKTTHAKDELVNPVPDLTTKPVHTKDTTQLEELAEVDPKSDDKTDAEISSPSKNDGEGAVTTIAQPKTIVETVKKCEAEVVECDSSVETSSVNEQSFIKDSSTPSDKSTILSKEEITQEFVEALIRKSFQSGEGKLLLAQVKLFEEFARKLNSKKLKTIQKIINSESGSSSSTSSSSSEDEKKKRKGKKFEEKNQKTKKRKKKIKSRKKRKLSSSSTSSSSTESEESSDDENTNKKEAMRNEKTSAFETTDHEAGKVTQTGAASEEKSRSNETAAATKSKSKKKRRCLEFGRNFSGIKTKRKQKQKKLLEKILNESPQPEANNEFPGDVPAKENEPKNKPRRAKTELDRLHEDIRRMFICEGVVTATGQRMCRILRQSGGNMNNLDIVKESAKMVEEEKLKKVQTRSSLKNSRPPKAGSLESRSSSSQSSDKEKTGDFLQENEEKDAKLACEPRVYLQRVDLDNFGYGVKLSDDCISFRRVQGRNTALRSTGSQGVTIFKRPPISIPTRTVFLARNKRKFERLRDSKCKKRYTGKKLADIVEKLPLKMAKIKHLQFCEKKTGNEENKKKQNPPKKLPGSTTNLKCIQSSAFNRFELLLYAFERKRKSYPCKLCSRITQNITGHYKTSHPEDEVLISRLCLPEARKAKLDSKKNGYYETPQPQNQFAESMKQKVQALLRRSYRYNCRMCPATNITNINNFASHVSSHTGEFRFQCPVEECTLKTFSLDDIKFHILSKHAKSKLECYGKIVELYPLSTDGCQLFGYLCSKCHYVQICHSNLEKHVARKHESSENVTIIRINMSSRRFRSCEKKNNNPKDDSKNGSENEEVTVVDGANAEEKVEEMSHSGKVGTDDKPVENLIEVKNAALQTETVKEKSRKRKSVFSESEHQTGSDDRLLENNLLLNEAKETSKVTGDAVDIKCNENFEDASAKDPDVDGESTTSCEVFVENSDDSKGSDVTVSEEGKEFSHVQSDTHEICGKLKVGPLEAKLFSNSNVLYECYVKGCVFTTSAFDLFEIHIKISHWKVRWNGICDICDKGKEDETPKKNTFQLLTALKHLKLHARERATGEKLTSDELIKELELLKCTGTCTRDDNVPNVAECEDKSSFEILQEEKKNQSSETPFPPKPLLRVRNLLGDRLSTPKADEIDAVANEEKTDLKDESNNSSMFTIENVRSLKEVFCEPNELKINPICSLKKQLGSQKTIIVRSCPTRQIAIQPKPSSSFSTDVGQINVVQSPVVRPVVLSPVANNCPIRILSGFIKGKPFSVKPVTVAGDTVLSSNAVPVIHSTMSPSLSPVVSTATVSPTGLGSENTNFPYKSPSRESSSESAPNVDLEVVTSPTTSKSPAPSVTIHHVPKNSDAEEADEKDTILAQRVNNNISSKRKSVKDAKIYHEMLTKTKLCHLFKCMGRECSFTCNNQNVFTQHIGLHEAQRRLKKSKDLKTFYLRPFSNKSRKALYWQQCAYCCEVLNGSSYALSQHVLEEHGHCMYQCGFCFYRAVSCSYVEIHQNLAHSQILKTSARVMYKCKPLRTPPTQAVALEKHGRKQSVRPYICDQCGRKFYIPHEFMNHLASEHQSVTAYTCHICKNLCFKINRLINHYKLHSYSTYQCAYCLHGTETDKEMMFHLCNFHFSQPPVMYVRALAEGQNNEETKKQMRKKKQLNNQLDSLKVITYESDTLNLDCVVEADPEEEDAKQLNNQLDSLKVITYESDTLNLDCVVEADTEEEDANVTKDSSLDVTTIAAELGISTDSNSSTGAITPLMQELASIGDKNTKNLTLKCLLPNAEFSSENENGNDSCSVLISTGLKSSSNNDMNVPLGQLPLEIVRVHQPQSSSPENVESSDKNLKLNEIIANFLHKKALTLSSVEEEISSQPHTVTCSAAVHKLPPVVLSRGSTAKGPCPPLKSIVVRKKSVDQSQISDNTEGEKQVENSDNEKSNSSEESKVDLEKPALNKPSLGTATAEAEANHPLITSVMSLSEGKLEKKNAPPENVDTSIVISDICSLSQSPKEPKINAGLLINVKSKLNCPSILKPPIIRVEDYLIDEKPNLEKKLEEKPIQTKEKSETTENAEELRSPSPDIIILKEEKAKDIVTVTLDSDDEKDEGTVDPNPVPVEDGKIRKEMEILRNQIATETGSLLLDETETTKPSRDLTLSVQENQEEVSSSKTLMSPIEEAICSLNKKLQSETEEAQKKEEADKEKVRAEIEKSPSPENPASKRPRTRFGSRKKKKEDTDSVVKEDGEDKKENGGNSKKFTKELTGKELFICGNEKCNFAAESDSLLKDHLLVCDFSRDSSMLVCPHCFKQMKHFHPYLEHLKYHGEKKFHCGLCSFSSAVDTSTTKHIKIKHRCAIVKILPKEGREGHFAFYPKNYKVDKVDFEVNGYSPGDEDKLPLQSVYQVNVKCAKCPYFTKVRSNMVRHLKIHAKSVETEGSVVVPSTAPTNPVPCLETKERMFDKMTNLAASSQLAQAKEKTAVESLSPEEEAKLPQFVVEQMRYKCCLPDCNYITVDDGMLKHHIKALHDEISYYSCPHCKSSVHVDVRNVTLDKIGNHLKHHDSKLYKCAHCIYFHYQRSVVEKHTIEKHPDRRYYVHTVREPKPETPADEESSSNDGGARVWKCGLCEEYKTPSKPTLMDHLLKTHNSKSKYKCQFCPIKGNTYQAFLSHFSSKHPGEKVSYIKMYFSEKVVNSLESQSGNSSGADSSNEHFDTTPLWQRGAPRIRHIRGILIEEEEIKTKRTKRMSVEESESDTPETVNVKENAFYCPLCTNKKKPFYTRNEECFRTHLYQELNYQQFACILCGKMFVDIKDFEKHHSRVHPDKVQSLKQTKEDHEIKFWVDQVIAKRKKQMEERKRKLVDPESSGGPAPAKKKKEG